MLGPRALPAMVIALAVAACSAPAGTQPAASGAAVPAGAPQTVLTIANRTEPEGLNRRLAETGNGVGNLLDASLTNVDERGVPQPYLAEAIPSQESGTWLFNPDGTMKTTYRIKPGLKWQDGNPLTAADFVFAYQVYTHPQVSMQRRLPETLMAQVLAPDERNVEITWRQIYRDANALEEGQLAPLPRHLLAELFGRDAQEFGSSAYWTSTDYVGSGPYRVTGWERGSSISFGANPYFVMGRPKIDRIEVRFVPDETAVVASMLAGTVDYSQSQAIRESQAQTLRDQWAQDGAGHVYTLTPWTRVVDFQYREVPNHRPAVTDVRVRRALMHAIDRQAVADTLLGGLSTPADTAHPKNSPLYSRLERAITSYPFDLRRTEALLGEAGWRRGSDGMYRDGNGGLLELDVWASNAGEPTIVADYWKQAGVTASPFLIPRARADDNEYRASFPATAINTHTNQILAERMRSENAPSLANRFSGRNRGTYVNPELDRLYQRFEVTIDQTQADDLLLEMDRILTAAVAPGLLHYQPFFLAALKRVQGVKLASGGTKYLWNIWEWTLE